MAARKVAVYTTVGETTYAPGEEVPADVVALIDNESVWEQDDEDGKPAAKKAAASKSDK